MAVQDKEMFMLVSERATALTKLPEIQKKMMEIAGAEGKDAAVKYVYNLAIATLYGIGDD